MAPEQLKQVETALHSEKAKQILGDDVTSVLGRRYLLNYYLFIYILFFLCTPVYFFEWCWSLVLWYVDAINIILPVRRKNLDYYWSLCVLFLFSIDTLKMKEEDDWVHFDHCYTNIYGNRKSSPSPSQNENVVVQVVTVIFICSIKYNSGPENHRNSSPNLVIRRYWLFSSWVNFVLIENSQSVLQINHSLSLKCKSEVPNAKNIDVFWKVESRISQNWKFGLGSL